MVLKVYGVPGITYTQTLLCVLEELNVPYEMVVVDMFGGENKTQAFKEKQPFGQVPYIDDGGFVLYETRAICYYLARKFGGGALIPDPLDIEQTALFAQAASVELNNFDRGVSGLVHETFVKRAKGIANEIDPKMVAHYQTMVESKLEGYEAVLSRQKYIAGDDFSLVDIFHLFYGVKLQEAGFDYLNSEVYPNIKRWWSEISTRPSWKKVQGG